MTMFKPLDITGLTAQITKTPAPAPAPESAPTPATQPAIEPVQNCEHEPTADAKEAEKMPAEEADVEVAELNGVDPSPVATEAEPTDAPGAQDPEPAPSAVSAPLPSTAPVPEPASPVVNQDRSSPTNLPRAEVESIPPPPPPPQNPAPEPNLEPAETDVIMSSPLSAATEEKKEPDEDELDEIDEIMSESDANSKDPVPSTSANVQAKSTPSKPTRTGKSGGSAASIPLPHFTVKKSSSKNSADHPHVISINAGVTDADSARWPTDTQKNGSARWNEVITKEQKRYKDWMAQLARNLVVKLGLTTDGSNEHWAFEDFPENYLLTVHHTPGGKPNGQDRTDAYLWGSTATLKFRTVNEFFPHLQWLLTNGPTNRISCSCKYCSGKKQGDVNRSLAVGRDSASATPVKRPRASDSAQPSVSESSKAATKRQKVTNEAEKKEKDATKEKKKKRSSVAASPTYDGAYTSRERDTDLGEGPLFRKNEMIWVRLPKSFTIPPTASSSATSSIFVDQQQQPDEAELTLELWPAIILSRDQKSESKRVGALEAGRTPSIQNVHSFKYEVQLLACTDKFQVAEKDVVPHLQYVPGESFLTAERLAYAPSVKLVWDGQEVLQPSLNQIKDINDAATPFALSMQMAAHVNSSFCLLDRYTIKKSHVVPLSNPPTSEDRKMMAAQLENYHYQLFWWGAEKIWSGELIRVLISEEKFPPGSLPQSAGSDQHAIFLRISAIYRDSKKETAILSGTLYELVDISNETAVGVSNGQSAMALFEKSPSHLPPAAPLASTSKPASPTPHAPITPGKPLYMPDPPEGYTFRCLTPVGEEVQLDMEFTAGRYYPLPSHLATKKATDQVLKEFKKMVLEKEMEQEEVAASLSGDQRSLVLAGLLPAWRAFMKCDTWIVDRKAAVRKAELKAHSEMKTYFEKEKPQQVEEEETSAPGAILTDTDILVT